MKGLLYTAAILWTVWVTSGLLPRLQAPPMSPAIATKPVSGPAQAPVSAPPQAPVSAPPQVPIQLDERSFTFCRVAYRQVRREPLGQGWRTDYPDGDRNLMLRLSQLTTTPIRRTQHGEPDHRIVQIMDEELFECPFIFMSDVGTIGIDPEEAERLRLYLEQGGFLWADDFWGSRAWDAWTRELAKALPPSEYPIIDIPSGHLLLNALYAVHEVPQVPSIQFWRRSGRSGTSERGSDSAEAHLRGIKDKKGRLIVVMTHNTDIADGWEREGEDDQFFFQFSPQSYALGINIVIYALTH